jgi:DMSO reductase family type II enzyme chaperone
MTDRQASATTTSAAIRRAAAYSLLADAFAFPDEPAVARLQQSAAAAQSLCSGSVVSLLAALACRAEAGRLQPPWADAFTVGSSPDCPSFETAYFSTDATQQTQRMADIAGFYRAFGVDASVAGFRPDDISVELEFMSYLCRKQAHAAAHMGAPRVGQVLRAQRLFLADHLGQWGEALGGRLAGAVGSSFYGSAGRALADWLAADLAELAVTPPARADAPDPDWRKDVPADEPCDPDGAQIITPEELLVV